MSITNTAQIWLSDAQKTHYTGKSLASSLYPGPVDIWLHGELGAGKTTFLQGLLEGLGVQDHVTSPTYALEQRYQTAHLGEILHIDLYRLTQQQARELLLHSSEHEGIRCIEWPERLETPFAQGISITLVDTAQGGRNLTITFNDIPLPERSQIEAWRETCMLPLHIARHCDAVADFSVRIGEYLLERGILVRLNALHTAGEVHDLLRFIDFTPGASHSKTDDPAEAVALWNRVKENFPGMQHEEACATFLHEKGYDALAEIVRVHGLKLPSPERTTIEQKLLFYADKRVIVDTVVTLEERFADFANRYGEGKASSTAKIWFDECKALEQELFPEGLPF